ncbi:MAG: rRNA synthase, partial [Nocardioidaceae bacterium]|nr:rRNA synthase [Nocardioidaceae bacterium]
MSLEPPDLDGDLDADTEGEVTELEHRTIHVPEGLAGERVDSALARLLGFSRTRASELVAAGHVRLDGHAPAKSDRVLPGTLLEVS